MYEFERLSELEMRKMKSLNTSRREQMIIEGNRSNFMRNFGIFFKLERHGVHKNWMLKEVINFNYVIAIICMGFCDKCF